MENPLHGLQAASQDVLVIVPGCDWLVFLQREFCITLPDKWHASPLYPTQCCTLALAQADDPAAARALERAVRWVLATQRTDGSWGRWVGTAEETAYALQILLLTGSKNPTGAAAHAAARGHRFLQQCTGTGHDALWHDKDLYRPRAIVAAAVLVSVHLARTHPAVTRAAARL